MFAPFEEYVPDDIKEILSKVVNFRYFTSISSFPEWAVDFFRSVNTTSVVPSVHILDLIDNFVIFSVDQSKNYYKTLIDSLQSNERNYHVSLCTVDNTVDASLNNDLIGKSVSVVDIITVKYSFCGVRNASPLTRETVGV